MSYFKLSNVGNLKRFLAKVILFGVCRVKVVGMIIFTCNATLFLLRWSPRAPDFWKNRGRNRPKDYSRERCWTNPVYDHIGWLTPTSHILPPGFLRWSSIHLNIFFPGKFLNIRHRRNLSRCIGSYWQCCFPWFGQRGRPGWNLLSKVRSIACSTIKLLRHFFVVFLWWDM